MADPQNEEFTEEQPLNENAEQSVAKRTFRETCLHVFRNITVEPCMLVLVMSTMISALTTQNLYLEKACRVNLKFSDAICDSLKAQDIEGQNVYERDTQKLIASAMAWKTYITATVPCFLSLFVGSWSDKTGYRKIFMLIPVIGHILSGINNMVNVYFFHQLPLEVLVFSEACLEAFTGGWCVFFVAGFSYISAITTESDRTFRMGLLNFSLTVGFPIGMGMSGILLKNFGYYGCYGLAIFFHSCNALYNIFVLKDPERLKEQKKNDGKGFFHFLKTFFNFKNVKATLNVVWKNEPKNRRRRLCLLLAVVSVLFGPLYGEVAIMYLTTRYRFNWDEVMFSIFQTYNFITHTIGTVFSILVFSKYLGWHDSVLGIISTLSKIASSFIYCFAPNERIFFIAPFVEILNGTALLAMRSILSKLVEPDELGKVNSIVGLTENLMPLLYVPLYTKVYTATMEDMPGAVFLMGSIMTLPAVFVFFWLFYEHRKQLKKTSHVS